MVFKYPNGKLNTVSNLHFYQSQMSIPRTFPIAIGNIVYLNGEPPQEALASLANQYIESEQEMEGRLALFNAMLQANGRPHGDPHTEIHFGPSLTDLIKGGNAVLRPTQWVVDGGDSVIYEGHGCGINGWWYEASVGVLFYAPFGRGLTINEVACVISETSSPHQNLIEAVADLAGKYQNDENSDLDDNAIDLLPESVIPYIGSSFALGKRFICLDAYWGDSSDGQRIFTLHEGQFS